MYRIAVPLLSLFLALGGLPGATAAPSVNSGHVVAIDIERAYAGESRRYGFWIDDDGHLLSEMRPVGSEDQVRVSRLDGTAIGSAHVVAHADGANIALLRVADAGSAARPLPVAKGTPEVGDRVFGVEADDGVLTVQQGSVSQFLDERDYALMRHNALVAKASLGLPLVNRCGAVAGMTLSNPDFLDRLFGDDDPRSSGVAYAARIDWLRSFLKQEGITFTEAAEVCLSAEEAAAREIEQKEGELEKTEQRAAEVEKRLEKARAEMEEARERRERIAEEAKGLRERLDAAESETGEEKQKLLEALEAAEAELGEARRAAEESEKNVAALQATFERLEAENARQRRLIRYGTIGGAGLLALILVGIVLMRRRAARRTQHLSAELDQARDREDEQREFEQRVAATPDVLLELESEDGQRLSAKLEARKMVASEGAVVGRSPNSADYVIGHEDVSRRHARFYMASGQLLVEDLESMNGTFVNGEAVSDQPTPVDSGAEIAFGALRGRVRY